MAGILNGVEIDYPSPKRTQVFTATHDSRIVTENGSSAVEWLRETYMNRSFISFSFGEKWIEDFGLIAVIENNRLQRAASAQFEDLTTEYEVIDGQFYWGTHFTTNELNLILATDGMTQRQLDDFKHWFSAGRIKELVLSEHPNRAIMARVSAPPEISMLPFEEKTTVKIQKINYKTSTTLYKGNITLNFIADEPFWYSKVNVLGNKQINEKNGAYVWVDVWEDANGKAKSVYEDKDALKIILEDGIPTSQMLQAPSFLGGDLIITNNDFIIAGETDGKQYLSSRILLNNVAVAGASKNTDEEEVGFINGKIQNDLDKTQIILDKNSSYYLYYPGTAPAYPIIEFTLTPVLNNGYICYPANTYANENGNSYNTLSLTSIHTSELKITTPGAYTGYNQAIDIFNKYNNYSEAGAVELIKLLRDGVTHKAARAWAIAVVDYLRTTDNFSAIECLKEMKFFLYDEEGENLSSSTIKINCKTGKAVGRIGYRTIGTIDDSFYENSEEDIFKTWGKSYEYEEDVGDMIRSNYLKIEDRNYPNENGQIVAWEDTNDITKSYNHILRYDSSHPITNVFITYKYMYY